MSVVDQMGDEEKSRSGELRVETAASRRRARHLLHIFPSFGTGGVQIRISSIINHFSDSLRHSVVALNECFDTRSRIDPQVDISYLTPEFSNLGLPGNLLSFRRQLLELRPDLLLTYNWGAIEWALANLVRPVCPHLHFESGFGPEEAERQITRRVLTRRLALARSRSVIVPSHSLMTIAAETWRLDCAKLCHIPNGIDCERFARAPMPDAIPGFTKSSGEVIVGTVAPLRPEKNLARLIRGFAQVASDNKARLLIVGDGPEREALSTLAGELSLADRICFAGHIDSVADVLGFFDVYALSSDTEQMPNSLLQAMAAGLPVAAVDVGDVKRIVAEENRASVVPRGDDQAFCEVLKRLVGDRNMQRDLGAANRLQVRRFYSEQRMFRAYAELFEVRP